MSSTSEIRRASIRRRCADGSYTQYSDAARRDLEWLLDQSAGTEEYALDRWEHGTAVAAVVHYALTVAIPDECINVLSKLCPDPKRPWAEIITEARESRRKVACLAEEASTKNYDTAALREP